MSEGLQSTERWKKKKKTLFCPTGLGV